MWRPIRLLRCSFHLRRHPQRSRQWLRQVEQLRQRLPASAPRQRASFWLRRQGNRHSPRSCVLLGCLSVKGDNMVSPQMLRLRFLQGYKVVYIAAIGINALWAAIELERLALDLEIYVIAALFGVGVVAWLSPLGWILWYKVMFAARRKSYALYWIGCATLLGLEALYLYNVSRSSLVEQSP